MPVLRASNEVVSWDSTAALHMAQTLSQNGFADRGKEETKTGNDSDRSTANLPQESSYPNPQPGVWASKEGGGPEIGLSR